MSTTYHAWQTMTVGDQGADVSHLQRLLAGDNRFDYDAEPGPITGVFSDETGAAVQRMKWHLGYPTSDITTQGGQRLRSFLVDEASPAFAELPDAYKAKMHARRGKTFGRGDGYPLSEHGTMLGRPYQGTHNDPDPSDPKHNWESCNAIDIGIPVGTTVLAVADDRFPRSDLARRRLGQRCQRRLAGFEPRHPVSDHEVEDPASEAAGRADEREPVLGSRSALASADEDVQDRAVDELDVREIDDKRRAAVVDAVDLALERRRRREVVLTTEGEHPDAVLV